MDKEKTFNNQQSEKSNCKVHVMPSPITDDDIAALVSGVFGVVKRKIELEAKKEILALNLSQEKLIKQLNEKTTECNRLKNEIIYLKTQLYPE